MARRNDAVVPGDDSSKQVTPKRKPDAETRLIGRMLRMVGAHDSENADRGRVARYVAERLNEPKAA